MGAWGMEKPALGGDIQARHEGVSWGQCQPLAFSMEGAGLRSRVLPSWREQETAEEKRSVSRSQIVRVC